MSALDDFHPARGDWQRRAEAAERTVDVLKRRVREIYDEGLDTPMHRQLARQQKRRAIVEARATELEHASARLEREVAARTRALRAILDNVIFGFLIVDREGVVQEGYTRSCATLFGRELAPREDVADLLQLDERERLGLRLALEQVFDDLLPPAVTLAQLPDRYAIGERILHLEGRVVRAGDGAIEGVLFTVSDTTSLEAARKESLQHAVLVSILRQRDAFGRFVVDTRDQLAAASDRLGDVPTVRRAVHTIKGNAASFGLSELVSLTHEIEARPEIDRDALDQIGGALASFLADNANVLRFTTEDLTQATYSVPRTKLVELRRLVTGSHELDRWLQEVVTRPARELLGPVHALVETLSARLEKTVSLTVRGADIALDAERYRDVFRNLPHLIRNAIDHGIEPSWARGDKPPTGQLVIEVTELARGYRIEVADDGRGVDIESVVRSALRTGLVTQTEVEQMSTSERLALIFHDGLSSIDRTTVVSGRGLGLAATRAAVEHIGGTIDVRFEPGRGTRFVLDLPRSPCSLLESRELRTVG